jgi:probable O-glycosylation ligase (exosortase A-associated)
MRDVAFAAIMAVLLPLSFVRPWIGILVWSWFGYMNPHQHCWGFARRAVPWAELIAIATLAGFVFSRERKPFIWCRESILMILLWIWFTVSTAFAWYPDKAWLQWQEVSKILLMTLLTIPLIVNRERMRWLLVVIAGSLGFYGFKAGLFVIATGGNYMVYGAPGRTFVSSNNTIALVLNMCLPLFWYLRKDEPRWWLRQLLLATFFLSLIAVPFTYSRGGVLGLGCVLCVLFARSRARYLAFPAIALAAVALFALAPGKWVARMETIQSYEQDKSANGRLIAWGVGYQIANDSPLVGGGFEVFNNPTTFQKYAPEYHHFIDAHSIYFNLLGEHGYVGLGLFFSLVLCTFSSLVSVYRLGRQFKELSWLSDYAYMLGGALTAYLFTGTFLSVAYFDLAWHFLALSIVLKELASRELEARVPVRAAARSLIVSPRLGKTAPVPVSP